MKILYTQKNKPEKSLLFLLLGYQQIIQGEAQLMDRGYCLQRYTLILK